jgi:hypothetical protein
MSEREVVVRRRFAGNVVFCLLGALLLLAGVFILLDGVVGAALALLVPGIVLAGCQLPILVRRAPHVRATAAGISFSGSSYVPWRDIKAIYEAGFDVRVNLMKTRTQSIAVDFHRKRTMFRLPLAVWLTSPFAVGDIDISPHDADERAAVIIAKLEAMRTRAVGDEDGTVLGTSELPAARVIDRG